MQGKNEKAVEMWNKVLELDPDFLKNNPEGSSLYNGLRERELIPLCIIDTYEVTIHH